MPALHDVPDHRAIISQVVEDMQVRLGSAPVAWRTQPHQPSTLSRPQRPLASTAPAHSEATAPEDAFEAQTRAAAYTGVLMLLQAAIRHRTKLSVVQADLTKMNAPEAFVSDFVAVLRRHRATLEEATVQHSTRFPALDKLKWRVDVTISSSSARRVMQPALLMETALSDGSLHSFEMPIDKFHALRHSVARMLLEMGDIRAHPVIQLAFDAEKAALDKP